MTTLITESNIQPGSVTANIFSVGVTLGGGGVTISNVIVTDSEFNNTANTSIPATGGFLKLLGSGFDNANVFFSSTLSFSTEVTANTVSSSEVRLTVGATTHSIPFNLFLINRTGGTATKLSAFTSFKFLQTAGWWGGGKPAAVNVNDRRIDRIIFNSDTVTALVRGYFSGARYNTAATGTNEYGWFGGGYGGINSTRVDRITFAADTTTPSIRGSLLEGRFGLAATGNNEYGWFGGGLRINLPSTSRIDRIEFAADTATAISRGPLSLARGNLTATGNDNYGWFGGGYLPGRTTVDRIDYSADTATATVRGPLSQSRASFGATGNDEYGWFGGGWSAISTVDRITFAADTATASVRGPLSSGRRYVAATGNDEYGWWGGGSVGGAVSTVDRITFAADTGTASVRGPLSSAREFQNGATSGIA